MTEEIRFYRASEKPFGFLSNLYRRAMVFEGRTFMSAEHSYQFGKPRKDSVREWLVQAETPSLVANTAHGLMWWDIAPGWSKGRRDRMRRVVDAKFRQHRDLAEMLLATGDAEIVECGTVDDDVNRRWGRILRRGEWVGTNWLGAILMETREAIRHGVPPIAADQGDGCVTRDLPGQRLLFPGDEPIRHGEK